MVQMTVTHAGKTVLVTWFSDPAELNRFLHDIRKSGRYDLYLETV